jgi:hypothetical protein
MLIMWWCGMESLKSFFRWYGKGFWPFNQPKETPWEGFVNTLARIVATYAMAFVGILISFAIIALLGFR